MISNKQLVQFWHCSLPATCFQSRQILSIAAMSVILSFSDYSLHRPLCSSKENSKSLSQIRKYSLFLIQRPLWDSFIICSFSPWSIYWKSRILLLSLFKPLHALTFFALLKLSPQGLPLGSVFLAVWTLSVCPSYLLSSFSSWPCTLEARPLWIPIAGFTTFFALWLVVQFGQWKH